MYNQKYNKQGRLRQMLKTLLEIILKTYTCIIYLCFSIFLDHFEQLYSWIIEIIITDKCCNLSISHQKSSNKTFHIQSPYADIFWKSINNMPWLGYYVLKWDLGHFASLLMYTLNNFFSAPSLRFLKNQMTLAPSEPHLEKIEFDLFL